MTAKRWRTWPPRSISRFVLVVGLRLGCLNHALLTAQAIAARGLRLAGWIGNHVQPRFDLRRREHRDARSAPRRAPARCRAVSALSGRRARSALLSDRGHAPKRGLAPVVSGGLAVYHRRPLEGGGFFQRGQRLASGCHPANRDRSQLLAEHARRRWCSSARVCLATFGIAALMTFRGFWPVLPFAGLEMVAAGLGPSPQPRSGGISSKRSPSPTTTCGIEHRDPAHYVEVVFPRHWARVRLRRPHSRLHPSRLTIESHGRQCEVGSFLTEQERRGLAQRLQRLIGRIERVALARLRRARERPANRRGATVNSSSIERYSASCIWRRPAGTGTMIRKALVSLGRHGGASPAAHAESGWHLLNMTQGVTDISRKIYSLHMLIFYVCVIDRHRRCSA